MPSAKSLTGAAGEHFVMYRLLEMGLCAALAPRGAENIDIIISDTAGESLAAIQVKSSKYPVTVGWQIKSKCEQTISHRLFYCFVDPGNDRTKMPTCWIVPSATVAEHLTLTHSTWLSNPAKKGSSRKDSNLRKFHHKFVEPGCDRYPLGWLDAYKEAWHLLPIPANTKSNC